MHKFGIINVFLAVLLGWSISVSVAAESLSWEQYDKSTFAMALGLRDALSDRHGADKQAELAIAAWTVLTAKAPFQKANASRLWLRVQDNQAWLRDQNTAVDDQWPLLWSRDGLQWALLSALGSSEDYQSLDPMVPGSRSWQLLRATVQQANPSVQRAAYRYVLPWARLQSAAIWYQVLEQHNNEQAFWQQALRPWLPDGLDAVKAGDLPQEDALIQAVTQLASADGSAPSDVPAASLLNWPIEESRIQLLRESTWVLHELKSRDSDLKSLQALMMAASPWLQRQLVQDAGAADLPWSQMLQQEIVRWSDEPNLEQIDVRIPEWLQQLSSIVTSVDSGTVRDSIIARRFAQLLSEVQGVSNGLLSYLNQPARTPIRDTLSVCLSLAGSPSGLPLRGVITQQYEGCLRDMERWMEGPGKGAELAGDPGAIATDMNQLSRDLSLDAGQRINSLRASAHQLLQSGCPVNLQPPAMNPLEWAYVAHAMEIFASRWPSMASRESARLSSRMLEMARSQRARLNEELLCAGQNGKIIRLSLQFYRENLVVLLRDMEAIQRRYYDENLKPESDLDVRSGTTQQTNWRPTGRSIGPCDFGGSCGVSRALPASRALFGLFPESYLMADQLGLADLSLCYTNVRWVNREAQAPAIADRTMAEYHGQLQFELQGHAEGQYEPLFRLQLTDPQVRPYLYGENSPEVLQDACPEPRIGTRVVSALPDAAIELVPRRLTYMTAARENPSQIFEESWDAGVEWKDWFVTGQHVVQLQRTEEAFDGQRLDEQLKRMAAQLQDIMTGAISDEVAVSAWGEVRAVERQMRNLETSKELLRALAVLYVPSRVRSDDQFRAMLYGRDGLLDLVATSGQPEEPSYATIVQNAIADVDTWLTTLRPESEIWRDMPDPMMMNAIWDLQSLTVVTP